MENIGWWVNKDFQYCAEIFSDSSFSHEEKHEIPESRRHVTIANDRFQNHYFMTNQ